MKMQGNSHIANFRKNENRMIKIESGQKDKEILKLVDYTM